MSSTVNKRIIKIFPRISIDKGLAFGLIVITLFLLIAILFPLFKILGTAISKDAIPYYQHFFKSPVYLGIIWNTVKLGLVVGLLGTAVGFLFAYVQVRTDVPCKRFIHLMALMPIISPPFAVATAAIELFGRSGLITYNLLGIRYNIYGFTGLTGVLVLSLFTVAYMNFQGMLRALDPSLDEAATNMGATKWDVFRTVTIPMLIPGIASSFLLLFVEAIADLANPLVLGGDFTVLASRVYIAIAGEYDIFAGAVLSFVLLVPSLTVFVLQRYWVNRKSVVSVTGKPSGRMMVVTNPFVRWGLFSLVMFFSGLILLIYGTIFVGAFTKLFGINYTFTLEHFKYVIFGLGSQAILDTSKMALIATPIAGLLGMLIAWLVVRKRFPGRGWLDFISMLGIAVPGTVLGIGYLLAFNHSVTLQSKILLPPLAGGTAMAGGIIALILAYIVRSVPAGVRSGISSLQQIDPSIEEASISLGANNATTFLKVTLPLIRPAFLTGLVYSFARSMTSLSAVIFLTTPEAKVMTSQILNEVDAGRFGNAFAYCDILILIVLTVIGILYLVVGKAGGVGQDLRVSS
ncbi:ABC-type Fe3+ transport system, permease component [Longilinea arvoryzae]|uniref:ABC-type Fe3+ transport system, permease component n=1 Tax=Longilinea arvoryzae TaxID=360412 RepID=A0A0K8MXS4_9CHLR|nr:iron ABC transporter permease [Longilinea arvoryzae]GAP16054.1 ABC-type Fe3+ transport system, permease component [Longilinea arvoryzae]